MEVFAAADGALAASGCYTSTNAGGGNLQIGLCNSDRFPVLVGDRLLGLSRVAAIRSIAGITQLDIGQLRSLIRVNCSNCASSIAKSLPKNLYLKVEDLARLSR